APYRLLRPPRPEGYGELRKQEVLHGEEGVLPVSQRQRVFAYQLANHDFTEPTPPGVIRRVSRQRAGRPEAAVRLAPPVRQLIPQAIGYLVLIAQHRLSNDAELPGRHVE